LWLQRQLERLLVELISQDTPPFLFTHFLMVPQDKQFLLAVKRGDADWRSFPVPDVERLPAIQWKLHNLGRMETKKRQQAAAKLEAVLFR
jgi:hypothetical protein